jgi:multicomponent K+:H+ antiporter subunit D
VVSIGTLLIAVGLFSETGLAAALIYLIHTTLVTAGMFLLADLIGRQRGGLELVPSPPVAQPLLLGVLFFGGAVALAGLPPLSGFLGKLTILQAAADSGGTVWSWSVILVTSLLGVVALSRSGSALFWRVESATVASRPATVWQAVPVASLLALSPLLVVLAVPVVDFAEATARQLNQPGEYIEQVLGRDYIAAWRMGEEE